MASSEREMCLLTMQARLLDDRALSCPGSLSECNLAGGFGLGRLHGLGDCVLSLRKRVGSYFGRLGFPVAWRAPLALTVRVRFLPLSRPGQPHQKHTTESIGTPIVSTRAAEPRVPPPSSSMRAFGGAGGNRTRVQQPSTFTSAGVSARYGHLTAGRRKARSCSSNLQV